MLVTNVKRALLNQFNQLNNIVPPIQETDVDWLVPEIWLQGDCNTRVGIQGSVLSANYGGAATLYFNRRNASLDLRGVKIPGRATDYTTTFEIYTALREQLGVPVMNSEFLDKPFTGTSFNLVITPVSMAYLPGLDINLPFQYS